MARAELRKLLSHGAIYAVGALLVRVVSFVMLPVYTRALSPAEYGVVDLLDTTAAVIVNLANVAITYSVMRFYYDADGPRARGTVISTALAGLAMFGTFAIAVAWPLGPVLSSAIFHTPGYALAVRVMAVTAVLYGLIEVPMTYIRARERPWLYLAVSLARLALGLGLNVALVVVLKMGAMGVVWANFLTSLIAAVVLAAYTLPATGVRVAGQTLRAMLAFGAPFVPGSLAMLVLHSGDRYILSSHGTLAEVGLYSLGYKLGMIITYAISVPFANVWTTRMYTLVDQPGGLETYRKVGLYYVYVLLFAWVGLSVAAPELVTIAAAPEFAAAAAFVPVIAGAYAVREMAEFCTNAFLIKKQTRYLAWIQPVVAVANLALTWALVHVAGAMGAAWATLGTFVLLLVLTGIPAERVLPMAFPFRRAGLAVGTALSLVALSRLMPPMPLGVALPIKIAMAVLFPAALVGLGAVAPEDRIAIYATLRRVRGRPRGAPGVEPRRSLHP